MPIPYIQSHTWSLGPLVFQTWGTFVALGILLGLLVSRKRAKSLGLDDRIIFDCATWTIIAALVGSRLAHILFYEPATYIANPLEIFRIWNGGMSVMGGFAAAFLVGVWFLRKKQVDIWRYADAMIFGLPVGLMIGRIGCFLIHDHPGTASDLILSVKYPDGVSRLDHGLLLSINGGLMALFFLWLSRKTRPAGTYVAAFALWYGVIRFILDFYRIIDAKYFGLTPAQYISALMAGFGGYFLWRLLCSYDKIKKSHS